MLRIHTISNAAAAKKYYSFSDYYLESPGEWLGDGAARLGLHGLAAEQDFHNLCDNINPQTGERLTPKHIAGRRVGWDFNFNATKSVSLALELTEDMSILEAHREAVSYAMGYVERDMQTRVRVGGADDNRITSNLVAMRVTHRTTRPDKSDNLPDPSLHDHVVVFNATYDRVEGKWKAAEIGDLKHDATYFEAIYHNRLASNLRDIGYGIRRKGKAFEIEGVSDKLIQKYSRRSATIEATKREIEEKYGVEMGPEAAAKLGATTRLYKADTKNFDLNAYWVGRLTDQEKAELRGLHGQKGYETTDERAVAYAIGHIFERRSVVEPRRVYEEAIRHGIGWVTPESVEMEALRQGLLLKDGLSTTRDVLAQEGRVVAWAREGRGTCAGMGSEGRLLASPAPQGSNPVAEASRPIEPATPRALAQAKHEAGLSDQQLAAVRHVWNSPDRVILIRGGAGTGKTHMMKAAIAGIDLPTVVLAPSSDASRGVLRKEGFSKADTLAKFLMDGDFQENARNGLIWVDEAGQVSMRQLDHLFKIADELDARVVLQGDKKQHGAIERGATLRVLEEFAGLPVAELTDIRRQKGEYKAAVGLIQKGDILGGYDKLASMGWVQQTPVFDHNKPIVDDYLEAIARGKSALIVAPTHAEGDEITAEVRRRLKEQGRVGEDEKVFGQLKPLAWTEAEKGDRHRYDGSEVVQFVRNSAAHKIGDRISPEVAWAGKKPLNPKHIAVYQPADIPLAPGDAIRITAGGKSKDGHRLDNGAVYTVAGFREVKRRDGELGTDIVLSNDWVLDGSQPLHVAHAYTTTSHASQGKTVDQVLIAMGGESRGAINAEQFYVSVSRGKESARIYTSLSPSTLREAIQRTDTRMTATELMRPAEKPRRKMKDKVKDFWKRMQKAYKRLREQELTKEPQKEREHGIQR